ncbi:hypothetical protein NMY22_g12045 [Coprinellus aureogranulatus]|nr:hypothetical protein NMY22_g12045 [Coprinellus aureogranulatus]
MATFTEVTAFHDPDLEAISKALTTIKGAFTNDSKFHAPVRGLHIQNLKPLIDKYLGISFHCYFDADGLREPESLSPLAIAFQLTLGDYDDFVPIFNSHFDLSALHSVCIAIGEPDRTDGLWVWLKGLPKLKSLLLPSSEVYEIFYKQWESDPCLKKEQVEGASAGRRATQNETRPAPYFPGLDTLICQKVAFGMPFSKSWPGVEELAEILRKRTIAQAPLAELHISSCEYFKTADAQLVRDMVPELKLVWDGHEGGLDLPQPPSTMMQPIFPFFNGLFGGL